MTASQTPEAALLPCPFCGGEADLLRAMGESWARCMTCETGGNLFGTDTAAIAAWNRRSPPMTSTTGAVEVRERVARAICDFEWEGSQPSFDRKPRAFHERYLAWADAILAALAPVPVGGGNGSLRAQEPSVPGCAVGDGAGHG